MALTKLGDITIDGERIRLSRTTYADGVTTAVVAEDPTGAPYGKLSVFVRGVELEPDCFVVKDYAENVGLAAAAASSGLFTDTGRRVSVGHADAPVWRIKGRAG